MNSINYKNLTRSQKEQTAKYVYKKLIEKMFYDLAPMSVWTNRIKNIIIQKQKNFKIEIDWDFNSISTWRSLFDILYKDLKLIMRKEVGDFKTKYEYHLKFNLDR
jgi:hypothetical protein